MELGQTIAPGVLKQGLESNSPGHTIHQILQVFALPALLWQQIRQRAQKSCKLCSNVIKAKMAPCTVPFFPEPQPGVEPES